MVCDMLHCLAWIHDRSAPLPLYIPYYNKDGVSDVIGAMLSELRQRFIDTLQLTDDEVIFPEDPQLFVALGAALLSRKYEKVEFSSLKDAVIKIKDVKDEDIEKLLAKAKAKDL